MFVHSAFDERSGTGFGHCGKQTVQTLFGQSCQGVFGHVHFPAASTPTGAPGKEPLGAKSCGTYLFGSKSERRGNLPPKHDGLPRFQGSRVGKTFAIGYSAMMVMLAFVGMLLVS